LTAEDNPEFQARAFSLGDRIRRARLAQRMSLDSLARALGVSKPSAWAWERDRARPKNEKLEAMAAILKVPIDDLDPRTQAFHSLADLVSDCRNRIAHAAGLTPENVTIILSFGSLAEKEQFVERKPDTATII
jgi:transcriptional regulator with XRE-family HTH domain